MVHSKRWLISLQFKKLLEMNKLVVQTKKTDLLLGGPLEIHNGGYLTAVTFSVRYNLH